MMHSVACLFRGHQYSICNETRGGGQIFYSALTFVERNGCNKQMPSILNPAVNVCVEFHYSVRVFKL